ncbi:MAG: hypothetical protein R2708_25080 [Vicinamibacterales bacterium]
MQPARLERHGNEEAAEKEVDRRVPQGAVVADTLATPNSGNSTIGESAVAAIGMASPIHQVAIAPTAAVRQAGTSMPAGGQKQYIPAHT